MRKKREKIDEKLNSIIHIYVHVFTSYCFRYAALLQIEEISIRCFLFYVFFIT